MNAHSIRHAWFPPSIPKRKLDREFDTESEWPSTYRPLSGSTLGSRPTKRLRHLEGEMAGLTLKATSEPVTINTNTEFLGPSIPSLTNQIHDAPLDGEAEPYISSIYEYASPHTGFGSSAASLPLRGEISEVGTSDEECGAKDEIEERQMDGMRMGNGHFVQGEKGTLGYTVYEPECGPEKRKREVGDSEHGLEKKGKQSWYEPEKDRIVILDLDSSEDESVTRSPRQRRSAFSLSSASGGSSTQSRSQSETQKETPEFIINPSLLSHILPPGAVVPLIPKEDNPAQAIVLYKPAPWATAPQSEKPEVTDIEESTASSEPASMDASPLIQDDDAMDIDS
ncbi:unnamed protein product [Rhizoctonia solani]|uniref:Uncharacterized protein n=2 Tax=Rhizoctonia solani TaxID=456999 RepID=A0A8H3CZ56_9AGAM|nr:hypothetical protein RSOL_399890 [Rhizoctonia solani AG-3 Rhs1AP]CAE6497446.1 unnamed protein product [Rhizoctonia solani]CAE6502740.1 unnamed protein product [Rhizoctonia solani]